MGNDKTNMIVAIALSLVVLLGWNYFVAAPRVEQQRQAALQNQQAQSQAQPPGVSPFSVHRRSGPGAGRADGPDPARETAHRRVTRSG